LQTEETPGGMRFRMLETIREFAAEQLTLEERAESERRHASYFHQWVSNAPPAGPEREVWFERFDREMDNLRAALTWALDDGNEIAHGLETAGALLGFWRARGHFSEGRRWYDCLLERSGETPTVGLAKSLYGAGMLASLQGEFQTAVPYLTRCLEIARALGDTTCMASAHNELGGVAFSRGDYPQARLEYENSLALARATGKPERVATVLGNLANVAFTSRDYASARALSLQALEMWRTLQDRSGQAIVLHNLANLARTEKQLAEARAYYEQSLQIKRDLANPYSISLTLRGLAEVATDQADYAAAARYVRESLALARELNARMHQVNILCLMITLMQALGEQEIAARMFGALETVRADVDAPLDAIDRAGSDKAQCATRNALGADRYEAVFLEGQTLTLEQALREVEETLAGRAL